MTFKLVFKEPPSDDIITEEELTQMSVASKGDKMTLVEFGCAIREGFYNDDDGQAFYGDRVGPSTITVTCKEVFEGYADYSYTHIYWMAK